MSTVLDWFFKKAKNAEPESSEQIRARLHGGEATRAAVQQRLDAARERLKQRDPKANAELQAAKAELEELEGPLEILKEELAEAEAREEAAELERKRKRRDELRPRLRDAGVRERLAHLLEREVDLLQQVAQVRVARLELREQLAAELREYDSLGRAIGDTSPADHRIDYATSAVITSEALDTELGKLDYGSPMRSLLRALRPRPEDYEARS